MKKTHQGGEPSLLYEKPAGDYKGQTQIDSIENVLPFCDISSFNTLIPRKIFTADSENRWLEQVKLFDKISNCNKRTSPYMSQLSSPHLIIDVGELYTRAIAFGIVEDSYRLLAIGESISTQYGPYKNIGIGVGNAVKHLKKITGYDFSYELAQQHAYRSGNKSVNNSAPTVIKTGAEINVVLLHKSNTRKTKYLRTQLNTIPCNIIFEEPIDNSESVIKCLNEIVVSQPDLIICQQEPGLENQFEMGFDELLNVFRAALPSEQFPAIFFYQTKTGPKDSEQNITGDLDFNCEEDLIRNSKSEFSDNEKNRLVDIFNNVQAGKVREINQKIYLDGHPTINRLDAASSVIQFLAEARTRIGGVLGVNLGYTSASMTTSINGDLQVDNCPEFGLRPGIQLIQKKFSMDGDLPWNAVYIEKSYIEEYLSNKWIYPFSIPATEMDLEIEYAIASQLLFSMVNKYSTDRKIPDKEVSRKKPLYELIIASGFLFSLSQNFVKDSMVLLNGIQPVGVVSMLLDRMDLLPAIGAAAGIDPLILVQVLESTALTNLGTFICAESETKRGTILLKVKINYECGKSEDHEIYKGDLVNFPLSEQEHAELVFQPFHKCDIGMGPGIGGRILVEGGCLGIVIDSRGRPIPLPEDKQDRVEINRRWENSLHRFNK